MISNFSELLKAANEQDQPQRLLLLFAKAENTSKKKKQTQQGTLSPVMCVDKLDYFGWVRMQGKSSLAKV